MASRTPGSTVAPQHSTPAFRPAHALLHRAITVSQPAGAILHARARRGPSRPRSERGSAMGNNTLYSIVGLIVVVILVLILLRVVGLF